MPFSPSTSAGAFSEPDISHSAPLLLTASATAAVWCRQHSLEQSYAANGDEPDEAFYVVHVWVVTTRRARWAGSRWQGKRLAVKRMVSALHWQMAADGLQFPLLLSVLSFLLLFIVAGREDIYQSSGGVYPTHVSVGRDSPQAWSISQPLHRLAAWGFGRP